MFYDGVFFGEVKNPDAFKVATDGMNDGYHELRMVGVSRGPISNRSTRQIGFRIDRKSHRVVLEVAESRCALGEEFVAIAESSTGQRVKIRQNFRTLATLESGTEVRIPSARLGLGKTKLVAVVELPDGTLERSVPVLVEVVRD